MSPLSVLSLVLLWAGVLVVVVACLGVALIRDAYDRLHFVAMSASAGIPLVALSLALHSGSWRAGVKLVLIGLLAAGTGPASTVATARARSRSTSDAGDGGLEDRT